MVYEFNIDIYFLTNFMVNFAILNVVETIINKSVSIKRLLVISGLGALFSCIIVILPVKSILVKQFLLNFITCAIMIKLTYKKCSVKVFIKGIVVFYIIAALYAGLSLSFVRESIGLIYLTIIVFCITVLIKLLYKIMRNNRVLDKNLFKTKILIGEKELNLVGLYDTGNNLMDPYFNKPVNVIDNRIVGELINNNMVSLRYIPYHSIGKSKGLMPVFTVDKLIISEKHICIENAVVGIADEFLTKKEDYQIILNYQIIND